MTFSIALKSAVASFLDSIGWVARVLESRSRNGFLVLTYHRILPEAMAWQCAQAGMYVTPETFAAHLKYLQRHFEIVPLSGDLLDFKIGENRKPLCVLTFDDGWFDFYRYAFPLLKAYGACATVFLPTDFVGTERWFWTDRLTYLFYQRQAQAASASPGPLSSDPIINALEGREGSSEVRLETAIDSLKRLRSEKIEEVLEELSGRWKINGIPSGRAFLSWDEAREMGKSGLIRYGSHSASHSILTTLTDEEIQDELIRSRERLIREKVVDPSFVPFCYPNGNYDERVLRLLAGEQYPLAVTTETGWNHPQTDVLRLQRIPLHQDMTSTVSLLGCRIVGIL